MRYDIYIYIYIYIYISLGSEGLIILRLSCNLGKGEFVDELSHRISAPFVDADLRVSVVTRVTFIPFKI